MPPHPTTRRCSVEGCDRPHWCLDLCRHHDWRVREYGVPEPDFYALRRAKDLPRFLAKVNKTETCWLWTGATTVGYGVFSEDRVLILAHRWSYQRFVGPIPVGLDLDHLCRVRSCVNPEHLEPVTRLENISRGLQGAGKPRKLCGVDCGCKRHTWRKDRKHGEDPRRLI